MRVDFGYVVKNIDGSDAMDKDKKITLGVVCATALMGLYSDERVSGEGKAARYELAKQIMASKILDVDHNDASLIRKVVGRAYSPLVVGQVYKLIQE